MGGGRVSENLRKLSKNFLRKLLKMHYLRKYFKKINKPYVNFSGVWAKNKLFGNVEKILKISDENSIEKLHFYVFLENILRTIEPRE